MNVSLVKSPASASWGASVAVAAAGFATATGAALAVSPRAVTLLVVLAITAAYAAAVCLRPMWAIGALLAGLAFIPAAGLPLRSASHPAVLAGLVMVALAAGGFALRPDVRQPRGMTAIDLGVGMLALGILAAGFAGTEAKVQVLATTLLWVVPFVVGRLIVRAGHVEGFVRLIVLFALALVPFAILEAITHRNIFFDTFSYVQPLESETLNKFERLGHLRVRTGWRHPILFAMFLSAAASFAGILALRTSGRKRWFLIGAAALLAGTQLLTYSRTGWLLLAVVGLLVVLSRRGSLWSRRERSLTFAAIVVLFALAALPQTRALFSGNSDRELQSSSEYRTLLTEQALTPGYFAPFGRSDTILGPDGHTSIDNAYILVGWDWGYLGLAGMALLLGGTVVRAIRATDPLAVGLAAVGAGLMVSLTGVALFGQLQIFVFLVLGAASGIPLRSPPDPELIASRS